jgi:hypothetical protein
MNQKENKNTKSLVFLLKKAVYTGGGHFFCFFVFVSIKTFLSL